MRTHPNKNLILFDQNNLHLNSVGKYYETIEDSEKKIYELSVIIENQSKMLEKLEIQHEELKEKLTEQKNSKVSVDYSSWVSLLLACVATLVTIFGVVMAIISFIGIKNIKTATNNIAQTVSTDIAKKVAAEKVDSQLEAITINEIAKLLADGTFRPQLEDAVDLIMRSNKLTEDTSGFNNFPEFDEELEK